MNLRMLIFPTRNKRPDTLTFMQCLQIIKY